MTGLSSFSLTRSTVDNSDWLKTAAILLVVIDHTGYFFIESAAWWNVFGRLAAPVFFFLLGFAHSRTIPFHWLWIGFVLTILDSWNNDWEWVAGNTLLSLAFIRASRSTVLSLMLKYGWHAFIVLILVILFVLPVAGNVVEFGSAGWLWALFGLCQRMYIDGRSLSEVHDSDQNHRKTEIIAQNWDMMRLLACLCAATVYIWQEQLEFRFTEIQLASVGLGIGLLSICLLVFERGPSRIQPSGPVVGLLHWMGRHTLEVYAVQLAGSELLVNWLPDLAA